MEELDTIRQQIDAIDDAILEKLRQRAQLVERVGHVKRSQGKGAHHSFIRPGREASMLRALTKKAKGVLPPPAIATMWRMVISSSLSMEQAMSVSAWVKETAPECYWLAREYFGTFLPIRKTTAADTLIKEVASGRVSVGILPLCDDANTPWWVRPAQEKNDIYVFARIPFVETEVTKEKPVLAIANVQPEPTGEDDTLLALEQLGNKEEFLKRCADTDVKATILATAGKHLLLALEGFFTSESKEIIAVAALAKEAGASLRLLGAYARPLKF